MAIHLDPLNARLAALFMLALLSKGWPVMTGLSVDIARRLMSEPLRLPVNRLFEAARILGVEDDVSAIICEASLQN